MLKMNWFLICLIKFILIILMIRESKTDSDQMKFSSQLRNHLLIEQKYDRLSKPVKNHTTKISFFMIFHLFQIVDLSTTGKLKTNLLIISTWNDEHLTWNLSNYGNLDTIRFGHYEIWKPDLVIWNYDDNDPWDTFDDNDLLVDSTGSVNWDALTHSITYCPLDLSEYPFDTQKCSIKIGPWMYNSKDLNITTSKTLEGPFYTNGEWIVTKKEVNVKNNVSNIFACVEIKLTLQRRTTIYTYFIGLPYLLSVLFILLMITAQLNLVQKQFFAGLSIFIQLSLIMFIISHIGFWTAKVPRAIRCMSINILFTICTMCLSTLLAIKIEEIKFKKLPSFIDSLLDYQLVGKIFILHLDPNRSDSNLMPFVNEDENERTNESSIEIQDENSELNELNKVHMIDNDLNECELINLKRWYLFMNFIDRLTLYIYLIILIVFHI